MNDLKKSLAYALELKDLNKATGKVFVAGLSIYIELDNKSLYNHKYGYTVNKNEAKNVRACSEVHYV